MQGDSADLRFGRRGEEAGWGEGGEGGKRDYRTTDYDNTGGT